MIAVDTNILVYAHRRDSPWHLGAKACVEGLAESGAPWAIPWPSVHEFLAIVTHPRIYSPPSRIGEALDQVTAWRESPSCTLVAEGPDHLESLAKACQAAKAAGPLVHDARIVAICLSYGVDELWSADRDFSRFKGLEIRNPL